MILYNTLTKRKQTFIPLKNDTARIYFCGMTVQESPHIGHIRAYMIADILTRYLEYTGYKVILIENFTDIDDKIIKKSVEEGVDYRIIAERHIEDFYRVRDALNIKPAYFYPRATQHIKEMIEMIEILVKKNIAYEAGGDVYFDVTKFPNYGKLSGKKIDELEAGARIEPSPYKKNPLDFALWKKAKENEPWWDSPWGRGRPGWHIECSVMSTHYLGAPLDIHAGGEDLIFPHHENEIAQYEGAREEEFARFWLHNAMLNLKGEKMSKSTKHFILAKEVVKIFNPNALRLFLLKSHYKSQAEYSEKRLKEAEESWNRIKEFISTAKSIVTQERGTLADKEFVKAMEDDLNTPKALGAIFSLIQKGYQAIKNKDVDELQKIYSKVLLELEILGFKLEDKFSGDVKRLVERIVEFREELRRERDYKNSDRIRDILKNSGIIVEDTKEGPRIIYR